MGVVQASGLPDELELLLDEDELDEEELDELEEELEELEELEDFPALVLLLELLDELVTEAPDDELLLAIPPPLDELPPLLPPGELHPERLQWGPAS
ncbi:MAG TPA: hypothetical protein PK011_15490, partial [Marinagarivorans sp.]|nr:hypothetical protein [Marinagarivorans sp.]